MKADFNSHCKEYLPPQKSCCFRLTSSLSARKSIRAIGAKLVCVEGGSSEQGTGTSARGGAVCGSHARGAGASGNDGRGSDGRMAFEQTLG